MYQPRLFAHFRFNRIFLSKQFLKCVLNTLPTGSLVNSADNLSHCLSNNLLFSTKVPRSVVSVALLCKLPLFYTNLKNLPFAMNEKNGIEESKPKQSRHQGGSAPERRSDVRMLLNRQRSVKC